MAFAAKVAQSNPAATTATLLYTTPASTKFVGRIVVANRDTVQTSFRLSIRIAGAGASDAQYLAYDTPIDGGDIYQSPVIALAATDLVYVYATDAECAFTLVGLEFT